MGGLVAARFVAELAAPAGRAMAPRGRCAGAVVAGARPRHERRAEARCSRCSGRWRRNLAVGNGLKPDWISRDPRRRARLRGSTRWCTTASRRGWCASSSTAARACASARARWRVPTLLMWAGADRCVAPRGSAAFAAAAPPALVHVALLRRPARTRSSTSPSASRSLRRADALARPCLHCRDCIRGVPTMNARDPNLPLQADRRPHSASRAFAERAWDDEIVPALDRLHRDPGQEPDVRRRLGAARLHRPRRARRRGLGRGAARSPGLKLEVVRLEGRTPVIFFEVPATKAGSTDTVLMYGHLDKQPEFNGWRNDLGPVDAEARRRRLLYGRGGADDGYAVYAAITAIEALDAQGMPRPRCVGLIESCEESGSFDLPAYLDVLRPRLGNVGLVVCLDSGAGNYDQLWLTTSLRGMVQRRAEGRDPRPRACTRATPAAWCRRAFASCARCSTGSKTARPAACCPRASTARCPAARIEQARATAAILRRRGLEALPVGLRRRRRPRAADHHRPGRGAAQPHLAADAVGHRRRRLSGAAATPATCCGRTPRSS